MEFPGGNYFCGLNEVNVHIIHALNFKICWSAMNLTHFASPLPFLCAHTWVDMHADCMQVRKGYNIF